MKKILACLIVSIFTTCVQGTTRLALTNDEINAYLIPRNQVQSDLRFFLNNDFSPFSPIAVDVLNYFIDNVHNNQNTEFLTTDLTGLIQVRVPTSGELLQNLENLPPIDFRSYINLENYIINIPGDITPKSNDSRSAA